ncbi:MAG: response regulator [Cycloclasticus sp.]|nr:response regulator [Cycloclasticus sp.]MBQ0790304.1 response regulator [Cycloclasticus sp.]
MPDTQKIMYVEDEPDIQTIARIALEQIGGFTLLVCSSGQEALDQVSDFAPDIILLDVMMPEMDGIETFRQLKTLPACAGIPVVFMTARVQTHEIKEYLDLGAVDVIAKPFSPITLADQVKTIIQNVDR